MTVKKLSLSAALHEAAGRPANPQDSVKEREDDPLRLDKPPSRRGLKVVSGHFDPAVSKQLWLMAIEKESSIQDLLAEALNDLFVKYQRNPIA